jgi:hypothetical protein
MNIAVQNMKQMGFFINCKGLGQTAAGIQARVPAKLDARYEAAGWTRWDRPAESNSRFQSRLYSLFGRKLSLGLAALLFAASAAVQATTASSPTPPTTIDARSPSLADVTTAINSANDGDTIIIPAGTASWTSTLILSKGITLQGQTTTDPVAGTAVDKTIIQDNVSRGSAGTPLIKVQSVLGKTYRVSGITFQPGLTQNNSNGAIYLTGNSHAVRFDHCHFRPMPAQSIYVGVWGAIYGVADHNVLECPEGKQSFVINMGNWPNPDGSVGQYGDGSWASPTSLGSEKFFFIEDNYIKNVSSPFTEYAGNLDSTWGGRWVFRHNHCYEVQLTNHGTEGGRFRGCRAREIYNNDFHYAHAHGCGGSRSGVTIAHDNTWDGVAPGHGYVLEAFRASTSEPSWGGGSGSNLWDVNDVANAPFTQNGFNYSPINGLYQSGTASVGTKYTAGSNTATLVDSSKNWRVNQWVNFAVKRLADNTIGQVTSNTSTQLTLFNYTSGTSQAHWTAGDKYEIRRPLILLDQPGRGQSDLITGTTPINTTTRGATWPHNALEPAYSWNNKYTPTGASITFKAGPSNAWLQLEGRDFFNNTPMPGYTPYVYPHPLTSNLAPPSNLTIAP